MVAGCLLVTAQVELWVADSTPGPKLLTVPLALLVAASVALRRRYPLVVSMFVMSAFAVLFIVAAPQQNISLAIALLCAWYGVAVWAETRGFLIGCAAVVATSSLAQLGPRGSVSNAVTFTVVPLVGMLIARRAVRERQLRAEALAARAEALERQQELLANKAVAEERARIARELHDLVAHNVSLMVVLAGAERHALGEDQAATREALGSIEQAGRQALAEARRLLGILRRKDDREELEPQPSIDHVVALVEQVKRAGLPVELRLEGKRERLPAGVDLCAYRIVQEGLTNTLKHAGPARAQVVLRFGARTLEVEVRDDGTGGSATNNDGAGHGLIGMRERVALYGGRVSAGPGNGGGYEIRAHLPLS